ncbi:uncharacterized protein K02A2.6-like [Lytechinus variegatus]|uniref:uncharacterized protein K02A2.6-like n=1 Tax=Lytechinus variegatus TaxID=7654 RepID=UPI001BB13A29|nr:uncharacterized protein K02A2.6-like [Lytechinus variegatus]
MNFGRIEEFQPEAGDFQTYIERFEQFLKANDVPEEKYVAVFLSVIGAKSYALLKSLLSPEQPSQKTYSTLVSTLTAHLSPKPLVIAERFKFHQRNQLPHESISDYSAELRRLSNTCEFGSFLLEALRDKFVCGLQNRVIQKKLLSEADLKFDKALSYALAMELADKNTREMKGEAVGESEVKKVGASSIRYSSRAKKQQKGDTVLTLKKQSAHTSKEKGVCYRCGKGQHNPSVCKYKSYKCNNCGKIGHLAAVCKSKSTKFVVSELREEDDCETRTLGLFSLSEKSKEDALRVTVEINDRPVVMEVDTGASMSVIPADLYHEKLRHIVLDKPTYKFKSYSGTLPLLGQAQVKVRYGDKLMSNVLIVADIKDQPAILGRNWLDSIQPDWRSVFKVTTVKKKSLKENIRQHGCLPEIQQKHQAVFEPGLGTMTNHKAKIRIKSDSQPRFNKARPVPYALKNKVEAELEKLVEQGILIPVSHSNWAAPIVVVPKADKSIRICGDYKTTINPVLDVDKYPLPNPQDLFSTLAGGCYFTKLDLSQAYQQMTLEENSREYLTINTHRGLFQYTRLPFGVASAPAIFQAAMEQVLQGLEGVVCFLDDMLISGRTESEHLSRLDDVLRRLEQNGLRLKLSKCEFMKPTVKYLGHVVDSEGLHPTEEKVQAVKDAPRPKNVQELRSYLGMLQYYARFLPNLSSVIHPLNELLSSKTPWKWTHECEKAFEASKDELVSSQVLAHYDVDLPLGLACDASPYGVGAVLSHIMPDGEERPIAFASRTLTSSERNYAQLEKEALALIFGVKKFHPYIYGRQFTLLTDHKPLVTILGPKSGVPTIAAARMQRWALVLSAYSYDIKYKGGAQHMNADGLSRLPVHVNHAKDEEESIFHYTQLDELPLTAQEIAAATANDPILSQVLQYTQRGWPNSVDDGGLKPYFHRRHELSVEQDVLIWGLRVVMPACLQSKMLTELHDGHIGMSRMKSLARSFFWWPKLDNNIESLVRNCHSCLNLRNQPTEAPLHSWKWPSRVWERVHADFAELDGQHFFLLVDVYSKWMEVYPMKTTTTSAMIDVLRHIFAIHGLPEHFVSDNGPQFISAQLAEFFKLNGVNHIRVPAYHPSSNGAVERCVQTLKQNLKAYKESGLTTQHKIANFLFTYRNTPHSLTGRTPAELLLRRQPRTRLSLIKPSLAEIVEKKQAAIKKTHDRGSNSIRHFAPGQQVMVRAYRGMNKWDYGTIVKALGPVRYVVQVRNKERHVHLDQIIRGPVKDLPTSTLEDDDDIPLSLASYDQSDGQTLSPQKQTTSEGGSRRYPVRDRRPPDRLDYK